jgi:hypothetical protein
LDRITLTLDTKSMDIVANALGMRPYVEVAQVLQNISQQIQAQQQPQPAQLPGEGKPNGAAAPQPEALQ